MINILVTAYHAGLAGHTCTYPHGSALRHAFLLGVCARWRREQQAALRRLMGEAKVA